MRGFSLCVSIEILSNQHFDVFKGKPCVLSFWGQEATLEYYHVVMETRREGKRTHLVSLDKTEKEIRRLAESLTNRDDSFLERENTHPSKVHKVSFFRTTKPANELILPNGKSIADYKKSECKPVGCCKHRYIATCLSKGKITEANECTQEFMASKRRRNGQKKT